MTSRPICALALNVARTESSNASSAVSTTTLVWIAGAGGSADSASLSSSRSAASITFDHCAVVVIAGGAPPLPAIAPAVVR